ncbi:MAG: dockerin type I domain-containing protein [Phycisphaerae bacterium]|nr:dockerin type I domain-containing protein [Phycisphaerae bacterium]
MIFVFVFALTGLIDAAGDLVVEGTLEANLDLPKVLFIIKRDPNAPALETYDWFSDEYYFAPHYAYLDTGASGILLSLETATLMGITTELNAQYVDVGVGGEEYFDVSEPLYLGVADYNTPDPNDQNSYSLLPSWHFQVSQQEADELIGFINLIGMPAMAGNIAVFDTGVTNEGLGDPNLWDFNGIDFNDIWDLNDLSAGEYIADIKYPGDPNMPQTDFEIPLIFENFLATDNPYNIPPLPVGAYNPLIKNVTVENNNVQITSDWLLDTGAAASIISSDIAWQFGLIDDEGNTIVLPDFYLTVGGVGGTIEEIPGYIIDRLSIPTLSGFNLVFTNACVAVHDIAVYNFETEEWTILNGIFGENFLTVSVQMEAGWPVDFTPTIFDKVVFDTTKATLGFKLIDINDMPVCGDANHPQPLGDLNSDCRVNFGDILVLKDNWLRGDCNSTNQWCDEADLNNSGSVDAIDFSNVSRNWRKSAFQPLCGSPDNPWPRGDFNRDCKFDMLDLRILADEWLSDCNRLNMNCRSMDIDDNHIINFIDYSYWMN